MSQVDLPSFYQVSLFGRDARSLRSRSEQDPLVSGVLWQSAVKPCMVHPSLPLSHYSSPQRGSEGDQVYSGVDPSRPLSTFIIEPVPWIKESVVERRPGEKRNEGSRRPTHPRHSLLLMLSLLLLPLL